MSQVVQASTVRSGRWVRRLRLIQLILGIIAGILLIIGTSLSIVLSYKALFKAEKASKESASASRQAEKASKKAEKAARNGAFVDNEALRIKLRLDEMSQRVSRMGSEVNLLSSSPERLGPELASRRTAIGIARSAPSPMLTIESPKSNAMVGDRVDVTGWARKPATPEYVFIILEAKSRVPSRRWYVSDMVQVEGSGLWAGVARLDKFQVKPGEKVRIMAELSSKSDQYKVPVPGPLPGGPKGAEASRVSMLVERKPR